MLRYSHRFVVLDPDVLRDMPRLERISLCGLATTDETLSALKHVPRLKWLRVSKAHVGDGGLVHVAALRDLELLSLEDTAVTEDGLRHLRGLNRLKWLSLSFVPTERAVPHVRALPNLQNLNIPQVWRRP